MLLGSLLRTSLRMRVRALAYEWALVRQGQAPEESNSRLGKNSGLLVCYSAA